MIDNRFCQPDKRDVFVKSSRSADKRGAANLEEGGGSNFYTVNLLLVAGWQEAGARQERGR